MENTNEKIKITSSEISEIIKEHKTKTNKDLVVALEFIKNYYIRFYISIIFYTTFTKMFYLIK